MQYICKYQSPLGGITVSADGNSLTGLWFDGQKYFAATLPAAHEEKQLPVFDQTQRWLDCYFSGKNPGFTPPLRPKGSPFRQAVWEILLQIPYGETITYKDIAEEIARQQGKQTMSAQAIGGAVGHNPISIIIPCHRVVGSDGSLTGYAGGIPKKSGSSPSNRRTCPDCSSRKSNSPCGSKDPPTGIKKNPHNSLIRLSQGFNCLFGAENGNRTLGFFPLCINMLQRSLVF